MTFPGESLSVDSFTNVSGAPVASIEAIQLRAGSSTFTAGDSVELSSDLLWQYLGPTDPVVVSWVVEVLSGSGTLTFAEGMGGTGTSLGSQAVTGPATVVVPSVAIDAADVYSGTDARLLLGCSAGSLEVQQVKLRVWPPEGVAGGWSSTYPAWSGESPVTGRIVERAVSGSSFNSGSAAADWTGAILDGQTHLDEPWDVGPSTVTGNLSAQTLGTIDASEDIVTGESGGSMILTVRAYAVARSDTDPSIDPSLGLVEGVDWIVPPDEVAWDTAHIVDATGEVGREWVNTVVTVTGSTTGSGTEGAPTLAVQAYTEAPPPFPTMPITSWPDSTAAPLLPGPNAVSVPDVDAVLFAASFSWMVDAPDAPAGTNIQTDADWIWALGNGDPASPDFEPLSVLYTYPAYRLWSPTAVAESVGIVRHWPREDGTRGTSPRRHGQLMSQQTGRIGPSYS